MEHTHTHTLTHTLSRLHTHTHTHAHTLSLAYTHTHTHTHIHSLTHTHSRSHTHTHTHHTHTHTHTHTLSHTHTLTHTHICPSHLQTVAQLILQNAVRLWRNRPADGDAALRRFSPPDVGHWNGHCTHTHTHTHREHTHRAVVGSVLAQGSLLSRGIEGGERALVIHSPPPTIPAGPETRTHDLRVTSPTLYP